MKHLARLLTRVLTCLPIPIPIPIPIRASARRLALAAITLAAAGVVAAQTSPPAEDTREQPRTFLGTSLGGQGYGLDDFNAQLTAAGYPALDNPALRLELLKSTRLAGRLQLTGGFYFDAVGTGDNRADGTATRSVDAGALGIFGCYDFDLLYPSAWNVMVGARVETGGLRVRTHLDEGARAGDPFARDVTTATLTQLVTAISPQVTVESVEFPLLGTPTKVQARAGYRVGFTSELRREGFPGAATGFEVSPRGLGVQVGLLSLLR